MTRPDSTPHLSLDTLADLLAGEGGDDDLAHVGGCAGCAGRLDELARADAEVAAVLAALPAPPMPGDLADRLTAALAAEPPLRADPAAPGPVAHADGARAAAAGGASRAGSATVTPFPHARTRRTWLPAAAAVAVLVSGGALGAGLLLSGGGPDDEAASSTAAGGAGESAAQDGLGGLTRNETGTDYAADGTLAAALPALLGGSAEPATAPLTAGSAESAPAAPAQPAPASSPGRLDARAAVDPALDRLRTPEGLASCLAAVLPPEDTSVRPLAVDYAAYGGSPALVVVLPAQDAPDKVDVFVVGPGCELGNDATLFFTRLDRPA